MAVLKHPEWIFSACFDKQADIVLTACRDGMARAWNWHNGTLAHPPYRHKDAVFTAAFTADEKFVVTACRDGNVRLWHRTTGRQVAPPFLLRRGHWNWDAPAAEDRFYAAWDARVTPDGRHAVVNGSVPFLYALHLGDLAGGKDLPLDDPILIGELLSGYRVVEDREVEGLTTTDWLARWRTFRQRHPRFGTDDP
jgi:WD40 repeat protein